MSDSEIRFYIDLAFLLGCICGVGICLIIVCFVATWVVRGERMSWTVVKEGYRYKRDDGALVRYDERSPYPNPAKESARMFTAWSPDPEDKYLERRSKRGLSWPRRWKNPAAAMKAVDKLYPERKP